MPTGVAIRDPRGLLFDAAERVLVRDGPGALSSRAVTAEAGVAKGVLHRHFEDFDAFLAEFAEGHVRWMNDQADALVRAAGTGTVVGNLAGAIAGLLTPATLGLIRLVIIRDELRAALRRAGHGRLPVAAQTTSAIAAYLTAERDLGRLVPDADIATLAPTLAGAAHLMVSELDGAPAEPAAVRAMTAAVLAGALR